MWQPTKITRMHLAAKVFLPLILPVFSHALFPLFKMPKYLEEYHKSTLRSWHSYKPTYVY